MREPYNDSVRPLYIFDLDGTLADVDHRRHWMIGDKVDSDWRNFYAECVNDRPVQPVIEVMRNLWRQGSEIWIWSGRSDEVAGQTVAWLTKHCAPFFDDLKMREARNHEPDVKLKQRWLSQLSQRDLRRIVGVFDDRKSVVDMWRANDLTCFQVAPGDF